LEGECLKTFKDCQPDVALLQLKSEKICFSTLDNNSIKIYSTKGKEKKKLTGHSDFIIQVVEVIFF
jgi:hypothetical protein